MTGVPPRNAFRSARLSYAPALTRPLRFQSLGDGDAGIVQTLAAMRAAMADGLRDPLVVDTARQIVARAPHAGHESRGAMDALFRWLAARYRYVRDPLDVEWLTVPRAMLDDIAARGMAVEDCESASTLLATLAEAVGILTRFRVIGQRGADDYSHVYIEAFTGRDWTPYDLTLRPSRGGIAPPGPVGRRAIFDADAMLTEDTMHYRTGLGQTDVWMNVTGGDAPWTPSYDPQLVQEPMMEPGDMGMGIYGPSSPAAPSPGDMGMGIYGPPSPGGGGVDTNTSPIDWSGIFRATGEAIGGAAKAAGAALPILERYGVVRPEYGHPFRLPYPGEPSYAYAASGGYAPYYGRGTTMFSALGSSFGGWGPWLAVGGIGLAVMALASRRRRR